MLNLLLLGPISHFLLCLSRAGQNVEKSLLPGFKTIFVHVPTLRAGTVAARQLHCSGDVKNVFSLGSSQTQKFLWSGADDLLSKFLLLEGFGGLRDALKMLAAVLDLTG